MRTASNIDFGAIPIVQSMNVQYMLWRDAGLSKPRTDKPNEQETGTDTGKDEIHEVYASTVKRASSAVVGRYSDTVIITIIANKGGAMKKEKQH